MEEEGINPEGQGGMDPNQEGAGQEESQAGNGQQTGGVPQPAPQGAGDIDSQAKKILSDLEKMSPIEKEMSLQKLQSQDPNLFQSVFQRMSEKSGQGTDMTPLPDAKSPRRESSPI